MKTFVFQPGMTWRKIGYALYSNSLSYREVLEQNPVWDVTQIPPPGTVLRGSQGGSFLSGASQQPSIYSLQGASQSNNFSPFDSSKEYYEALAQYSSSALRKIQFINGLTSDSKPARTGVQ